MRAPLIVGLLAVALGASACSAENSVADGLITEITSPISPEEFGSPRAVGPAGEALVMLTELDSSSTFILTLVLVDRDGTNTLIATVDSELFVYRAAVSDRLIAWVEERPATDFTQKDPVLGFYDRTTGALTRFELSELTGSDWGSSIVLDFIVTADVVLLTASEIDGILAVESDGDVVVFGTEGSWIGMGLDGCATDTRIWAHEVIKFPHKSDGVIPETILRSFRVSPGPVIEEITDDAFITSAKGSDPETNVAFPSRCGESVLGTLRAQDSVTLVEIDAAGFQHTVLSVDNSPLFRSFVTPTALVATRGLDGDVWVVDRSSGATASIEGSGEWCYEAKMAGDYIMWQSLPKGSSSDDPYAFFTCETFVGRLP